MPETTGYIPFTVGNETYQTWYKIVGDIHSGVRPLVMCHGGPGFSHDYLISFKRLHTHFNIPVIFYDQLGCGHSSHPKDVPEEFWRFDLWIDELDNLVNHLGVKDNFDLCGHSGGVMLVVNYVCDKHPPGLHRLVLASGAPSTALWVKSTREILHKLPKALREMFERHEREGTTDDPEYLEGRRIMSEDYLCRLKPWPEELLATFAAMEADPTVSRIMQVLAHINRRILTFLRRHGTAEFTITGKLKDWSCLDRIHTIKNTTLLTNGVDDPSRDVCLMPFYEKIEKVRWVTFSKSSHMAFLEEPDRYFDVVGRFLTK